MATLYIVSTPIGNLEDFSFRGLRILKEVDLILCEDTRITKKLLRRHHIETPVLSYHRHSKLKKVEYIIRLLKEGKNLALVSDAGTPGISDPGNRLIVEAIAKVAPLQIEIVPIPGPSAVIAAASISGFPMDKFIFMGFPPVKKKRKKFFEEVVNSKYPVIFYESPHRIIRTLNDLCFHALEHRSIVVCRELTKKFETIYRGTIGDIIRQLEKGETRGEFVVIL